MLSTLTIENIAVIEQAEISFEPGLNVMTGETGAGKSIVIDAINAVLGERTSRELVRADAPRARVSALFLATPDSVQTMLRELGIEPEDDGSLLVQRVISVDGKNTCRVNGKPVTVSMLKKVTGSLINIHGQHDSQALLSPETHVHFLDAMAENDALRTQYRTAYQTVCQIKKECSAMQMDEAEKSRRMDLLRFQVQELESAQLRIGEREELTMRRDQIQHAEKITQSLHAAYDAMQGAPDAVGAGELMDTAVRSLEGAAVYFPEIEPAAARLREMRYELEELTLQVRDSFDTMEYDPCELEEIEARLDELYRLSRKYGETEEEMLAFLENAREELDQIAFSDEHLAKLQQARAQAEQETKKLAVQLSESRRKAGTIFARRIEQELSFLDMPHVRFSIRQEPAAWSEDGADAIEFLISANPGEPPRPLAKIASGGELSRIMLAVKNVLSDKDAVGTMIFDEIDTGVSGRAAQKIAQKLKQVSIGKQVICVTHLSQIAAQADHHFLIEKQVRKDQTFTQVRRLDWEGRKRELARIIGGLEVTDLQLQSAEEMLRAAGQING